MIAKILELIEQYPNLKETALKQHKALREFQKTEFEKINQNTARPFTYLLPNEYQMLYKKLDTYLHKELDNMKLGNAANTVLYWDREIDPLLCRLPAWFILAFPKYSIRPAETNIDLIKVWRNPRINHIRFHATSTNILYPESRGPSTVNPIRPAWGIEEQAARVKEFLQVFKTMCNLVEKIDNQVEKALTAQASPSLSC